MSFTSDTRLELARVPITRARDAAAELCGAALSCGGLSYRGPNRYALRIQTESREILERHLSLFRRFLGVDATMRVQHTDRLGGQAYYVLSMDDANTDRAIAELRLTDPEQIFGIRQAPDLALLTSDSERRACFRGAFMLCGSISNPERSYHLEFTQASESFAQALCDIMAEYGLGVRLSRRKSQTVAYIKDGEAISTALTLMGASQARLRFEDVRALKSVRNDVNRQVNCDSNNMDKVVAAAEKQISMIRAIEKRLGMNGMPEPLREVAMMRLEYPDASLTELGGMLTPPLGKSGVNARMRKLEALAEDLVNG